MKVNLSFTFDSFREPLICSITKDIEDSLLAG